MPPAPRARSFGWVRPQQPSIGMLDFYVDLDDDSGLVLAGRYELRRLIGTGANALVYDSTRRRSLGRP